MKPSFSPDPDWWMTAFWQWLKELANIGQVPIQKTETEVIFSIRVPRHFPRWKPTPLQNWLRTWGIVQSLLGLIPVVATLLYYLGTFAFLAITGTPGPDGAWIFIFIYTLLVFPFLCLQLLFFLRSARRGALLITLFFLLPIQPASQITPGLVAFCELSLFLALWLTGGVRHEVKGM